MLETQIETENKIYSHKNLTPLLFMEELEDKIEVTPRYPNTYFKTRYKSKNTHDYFTAIKATLTPIKKGYEVKLLFVNDDGPTAEPELRKLIVQDYKVEGNELHLFNDNDQGVFHDFIPIQK